VAEVAAAYELFELLINSTMDTLPRALHFLMGENSGGNKHSVMSLLPKLNINFTFFPLFLKENAFHPQGLEDKTEYYKSHYSLSLSSELQ